MVIGLITNHRCPVPIGWLINRGGWWFTPLTTGFYDDRWYTNFGHDCIHISWISQQFLRHLAFQTSFGKTVAGPNGNCTTGMACWHRGSESFRTIIMTNSSTSEHGFFSLVEHWKSIHKTRFEHGGKRWSTEMLGKTPKFSGEHPKFRRSAISAVRGEGSWGTMVVDLFGKWLF